MQSIRQIMLHCRDRVSLALPALAAALLALAPAHPARALEGGAPAGADALARAAVAVQAVKPHEGRGVQVAECSGSLISPDTVLTAAHCLDIADGPQFVAVFLFDGAKALAPPLTVRQIVRHPSYTRGWWTKNRGKDLDSINARQADIAADLAVLKLATPVSGRTPLLLSGFVDRPPPGARIAAAGNMGPGGKSSGTLKTASLDGINLTRRGASLAFASFRGGRVCTGDSGAPVVATTADGPRLWGITGAVFYDQGGCSSRIVVVPVNPDEPGTQALLRAAVR